MKTLKMTTQTGIGNRNILALIIAVMLFVIIWQLLPTMLRIFDTEVGSLDSSIWQLLLFAIISFTATLTCSLLLFKWALSLFSLPTIHTMVSQFKNLTLWQQFVAYWASFALLFAGALLSLAAIF